jgi:putative selenate reductase molybdopterin-binding subunit
MFNERLSQEDREHEIGAIGYMNTQYISFGAKSVAEISTDGVAPAVASALHDATGVWMRELPYTPERVQQALQNFQEMK